MDTFPNLGGRLVDGATPANGEVLTWNAALGVWVAMPSTGGPPLPHAASHEAPAGTDQINVAGLSGILADAQNADHLQGLQVSAVPPLNNQVLVWNSSASEWQPATNPNPTPFVTVDPAVDLDVYVDVNNGNDLNTGLTKAQALQTLTGLYRKFPLEYLNGAQIRVHLAGTGGIDPFENPVSPATYPVSQMIVGGGSVVNGAALVYRGPHYMPLAAAVVTPAITIGAVGVSPRGFAAVAPLLATRITLAEAFVWANHVAQGYFCRVTRGGLFVIPEFPVCDSGTTGGGANWIDVDWSAVGGATPITNMLQPGDTVEIVEPGANLHGLASLGALGNALVVLSPMPSTAFLLSPVASTDQGATFERLGFPDLVVSQYAIASFDRTRLYGGGSGVPGLLWTGGVCAPVNVIIINGANLQCQGNSAPLGCMCRPDSAIDPIYPTPAFEILALDRTNFDAGSFWEQANNISIYNGSDGGLVVQNGGRITGKSDAGQTAFGYALVQGLNNTNQGIAASSGGVCKVTGVQGGIYCTTIKSTVVGQDLNCDGTSLAYDVFEAAPYNGNFFTTKIDTVTGQPYGQFSIISKDL